MPYMVLTVLKMLQLKLLTSSAKAKSAHAKNKSL